MSDTLFDLDAIPIAPPKATNTTRYILYYEYDGTTYLYRGDLLFIKASDMGHKQPKKYKTYGWATKRAHELNNARTELGKGNIIVKVKAW